MKYLKCVQYWIAFNYFVFIVMAEPNDIDDQCVAIGCVGQEYECINRVCYCAVGYIPNAQRTGCVTCPELGEACHSVCCGDHYNNQTLHCWRGVCQICYDIHGNWICRNGFEQIILISITQVIMASALIFGVIATFVLLYKLCMVTTIRPRRDRSVQSGDSRLSVGSFQIYVDERLRDAPPRYTITAPPTSPVYPAITFINTGFVHDSSVPPPPYTAHEIKEDDPPSNTNPNESVGNTATTSGHM